LEGRIYIDGQPIGKGEATSSRLQPGDHQVIVMQDKTSSADTVVNLGVGEKRILTLKADDLKARPLMTRGITPGILKEAADSTTIDSTAMAANVPLDSLKAQVTITAPDEETQILLNREPLAFGKWEGKLALGFYAVSTLKEGLESKQIFLWVDDTLPKVLDMSLPKASYGVLNIHSNVVGATIILNRIEVGVTPCILENLPATVACKIQLKKAGYRDAKLTVMPVPNDMLDVELNMKPDN
jgi:translation elongation factor EF-1beta